MGLFEAGWRRTGFGTSDDELQYRDRAARGAAPLLGARARAPRANRSGWSASSTSRSATHHVRGRVDRVDRLPDGELRADRLQDRRAQERGRAESDLQLALYRLAAREAWDIEAADGSYYYVLDAEKVAAPTKPDDAERVERTVLQVGEGVLGQDFEPRPSPAGLQLVRLPPDLPRGRELSALRAQLVALLAQEAAGTRGRSCRAEGSRPAVARAARPARPRSARPAPRSRGWRRPRGRSAPRSWSPPPRARRPRRRSRSGPRAGAAAPAPPSGWGRRRRSAAPRPRARPSVIPTLAADSRGRRRRSRSGPRSWSAAGRARRPAPRRRRGR